MKRTLNKISLGVLIATLVLGTATLLIPTEATAKPPKPCNNCSETKLIGGELCFLVGCKGKTCQYNCEIIDP